MKALGSQGHRGRRRNAQPGREPRAGGQCQPAPVFAHEHAEFGLLQLLRDAQRLPEGAHGRALAEGPSCSNGPQTARRGVVPDARTSSTGRVSTKVRPEKTTYYRFRFAGDPYNMTGSSVIKRITPKKYVVSGTLKYRYAHTPDYYLTKGKHRVRISHPRSAHGMRCTQREVHVHILGGWLVDTDDVPANRDLLHHGAEVRQVLRRRGRELARRHALRQRRIHRGLVAPARASRQTNRLAALPPFRRIPRSEVVSAW